MSKLPWSERLNALQINPDMATREDIANMAEELCEKIAECERLKSMLGFVEIKEVADE